jgi:flavin-binding protein dodecin
MIFIPMLLCQFISSRDLRNLHTVYIVPARREGKPGGFEKKARVAREGGWYNEHYPSSEGKTRPKRRGTMDSVYKVIEIVGTSKTSWEAAAKNAVETAGKSLEDLRVAEVVKLDMAIDKNKVVAYRARVNLSFKYRS